MIFWNAIELYVYAGVNFFIYFVKFSNGSLISIFLKFEYFINQIKIVTFLMSKLKSQPDNNWFYIS